MLRLPAVVSEIKWRIFEWQLEAEADVKRGSAEELPAVLIAKLRSLLARTPYWVSGHLRLAQRSLRENDIETAFISAQAALTLNPGGAPGRNARAVQVRCYMKRGAASEARVLLNALLAEEPGSPELLEDLAALCIQEGGYAAAVEALERVPKEALSAEGQSALQFARSKIR